jgi:hypothetical protein
MNVLVALLFVILLTPAFCQEKIASVATSSHIVNAYVDRVGELFVMTDRGEIQRYSTDGTLIAAYKRNPPPTLFDPRDGARLFAFFRNDRRIEYLSPGFVVTASLLIDSAFVIDPRLAFTSGDYNLWIVDGADGTLKKFNPRESVLLTDTPINDPEKVRNMTMGREYQGFVFLLDKAEGIQVFNGMGHKIRTMGNRDLRYFNFFGEEIYYPEGNALAFVNLFTGEKRSIPISVPFEYAFVTDERMYIVSGKTLDFFRFRP